MNAANSVNQRRNLSEITLYRATLPMARRRSATGLAHRRRILLDILGIAMRLPIALMRILAPALLALNLWAVDERGTLILHFLRLPVGEESYTLASGTNGALLLRSTFEYTERGSKVPLTATLQMKADFTPTHFVSKGKSYRPFSVDAAVDVNEDGRTAAVREGNAEKRVPLPERYFTISGYNPFSIQMAMLRYWLAHGKPARLPQLPAATTDADVTITEAGEDTIRVQGKRIRLKRYSLAGVVWGRESVWLNESHQIAAAATFAGGLPFEAIRREYNDALPQLLRSSDADRIRELTALSSSVKPLVQGDFAITGANLIDGKNSRAAPGSTIVVRNGIIAAVGPRSQISVPSGISVIDAHGATLLPGLWEMHAHFAQVEYGPAYLAAGVTTARDCGGEFDFITAARDAIDKRGALGPQLVLAGLVDRSGPGTFTTLWADTPEEGRAMVAKYRAADFAQMKIYTRIKPDVLRAIAEAAHRAGMTVTGHVPEGMTAQEGVEAGMDQINHFGSVLQAARAADPSRPLNADSPGVRGVIQFFKDHHTVIDPTLAWGELLGRPTNVEIATFEPGYAKAPYTLTSVIGTAGATTRTRSSGSDDTATLLRALYRAGVPIVAGTDKAVPGHSLHRELELYVRAGLTPMEVIHIATIGAAQVMGMDSQTGSIEPGKRADFILVDGDPLQDFASLRKIIKVASRGRVYDPAVLWRSVGFRP